MIIENKGVKNGHTKVTSCLNEYLDKKESEAAPVSDREAVLCIAQRHSINVHEK